MSAQQLEIEDLIRKLGKEILPEHAKLLLFGSQARDDARPDSDWNLLILLEGEKVSNEDYDTISYPLRELGWELGEDINTVLYTVDDWAKNSFTPFYKNVMRERVELN